MHNWAITATLALTVLYHIGRRLGAFGSRTSGSFLLPPGPPGLPWFGNVFGINIRAPWVTYAEWAKTYGDLVYSRLMGKDIIIINSEKIAKDLLESRSRNYSDRPYLVTNTLCGMDFNSILMPYGDRWRLHRRFFHQTFRLNAATRFFPLQHRRVCHLLRQLLDTPEQLDNHVFEYTASVMLNSVYDYEPASREDEMIRLTVNVLKIVGISVRPDIAIVAGAFPLLLRLPSWLPGMSFKRDMDMARTFCRHYLERPYQYFIQREPTSIVSPSMVHDALQQMEERGISFKGRWMEGLKEASGTAFLAASETSNAVLMTFFLMMLLNPALQEKAQAQIDDVVGKDKLPTMDDRPMLPFVDAIFWETLRCHPVAPLAIPHATVDDDVYGGFHIPKGAIILVNIWSMTHDESKFPDPYAFIPERFLDEDGSLISNRIEHIVFGFGRRICVGRHFANSSVWAVMAKVLAVFKILKPLDENGIEIPVEAKFSTGLSVRPLAFKFRIVPRISGMDAEKLEQLIAASTP